MTALRDVQWLVVHTAAFRGEAGAETIRRWHVEERGWRDIGYAWVVRRDGALEEGRPEDQVGAHVAGINDRSIGICCEGHGDYEPHTPEQRRTLLDLLHDRMKAYTVPVEGVIGHQEVNDLIDAGEVDERWRTTKSCPGEMVDMDEIRAQLAMPLLG